MTPQQRLRIEELFHAAGDLAAGERAAYLEKACGDDREVKAEVESLLVAGDHPLGVQLKTGAAGMAGLRKDGPSLVGCRVGRFQVRELIGEGGMGVVYLAEQEDPKRHVALKVIRQGSDSATAARRFNEEIRLLGTLRHEGIARVFEAGVHGEGAASVRYFAMEYLAGAKTITEHAAGGPIPEMLNRFAGVCDAVAHAHARGIIHRDLKPSNILVGDDGSTKVIDFGVARAVGADAGAATRVTEAGSLTGTLQYMSPEQCIGDHVDTRSDVYALGLILYEMLTGCRPYELSGASMVSAARLITEQAPTPPSKIDAGLRGDLETIALKALEKKPDRRYQSAAALADDVRRYLAQRPIHAKPDSRWYRFTMFRRRNRAAFWVGVAALVALLAGLGGTTYGLVLASAARADAEAFGDYFDKHLQSLTSDGRIAPELNTVAIMTRMGVELDRGDLNDRPAAKARVLRTIAGILDANGEHANAEWRARKALEIERGLHSGYHENVLKSLRCLADVLVGGTPEQKAEAITLLQEARNMAARHYGESHLAVAAILNQMASTLQRAGQFDAAVKTQMQAVDMYKSLCTGNDPAEEGNRRFLGFVLEKRNHPGDNEEAEKQYKLALDMRRRLVKANHPNVASALPGSGTDLTTFQPDDDPEIASIWNSLGWVRHSLERDDEAEAAFKLKLDINRRVDGAGAAGVAGPITAFADHLVRECKLQARTARLHRAERLYVEALAIQEQAYGNDHIDRISTTADLANCRSELGKFLEASQGVKEATDMADRLHLAQGDETRKKCHSVEAKIKERLESARAATAPIVPEQHSPPP